MFLISPTDFIFLVKVTGYPSSFFLTGGAWTCYWSCCKSVYSDQSFLISVSQNWVFQLNSYTCNIEISNYFLSCTVWCFFWYVSTISFIFYVVTLHWWHLFTSTSYSCIFSCFCLYVSVSYVILFFYFHVWWSIQFENVFASPSKLQISEHAVNLIALALLKLKIVKPCPFSLPGQLLGSWR